MIFSPSISYRFPSKKRLYYHRKHHSPSQDVVCDICGKVVRTTNTLNKHKATVHRPKSDKIPQQCKYCDKWYSTRGTLSSHVLNMHVHADEEHRCEICGFVSSSRDGKAKHKRFKHSTEKRYKCSICEKAFKVPTLLKEHMAIHTGVDLYNCNYCSATFKSKSNRSNHSKRVHPVEYVINRQERSRPSAIQPSSTKTGELD